MARRYMHSILALLILIAAGPGLADEAEKAEEKEGVRMEPGLWLFDVEVSMPMQGDKKEQKLSTCVLDDPMGPEDLMPWADDYGCKIKNVKVENTALSWKMRCNVNGFRQNGSGHFEVKGREAGGEVTIEFEIGGRKAPLRTRWTGEHKGACPVAQDDSKPEAGTGS